jgi:hypothetical protein
MQYEWTDDPRHENTDSDLNIVALFIKELVWNQQNSSPLKGKDETTCNKDSWRLIMTNRMTRNLLSYERTCIIVLSKAVGSFTD